MRRDPVLCDIQAARYPNIGLIHDVIEEPFQRHGTGRMTDDSIVQTDRHHLWVGGAFFIEHVKSVTEESEQVVRRTHPTDQFAVIVG